MWQPNSFNYDFNDGHVYVVATDNQPAGRYVKSSGSKQYGLFSIPYIYIMSSFSFKSIEEIYRRSSMKHYFLRKKKKKFG